ncbi:MAG: sigma-54-dependent Fis family transcriptional regulator [Methanobacteriota archaeon]|nr:MAG: sigma-54-dependent Fis family transcriptional regulator [Euryarchaeota archaeon]
MRVKILVVDDEKEMLVSYQRILKKAGYQVCSSQSAEKALKLLEQNDDFSLIICDLKMPGMDGMELLYELRKEYPFLPVIMVTGHGTLEKGIEAVKQGAFDFIEKPFSSQKLIDAIEKALQHLAPSKEENSHEYGFGNIIGKSEAMRKVFQLIKKVAYGDGNVMITGESGVGKELVARCIHKHSARRNQPLIPINCGAIPESLFESELFGYEKGAFTGAYQAKPGLVELANGGTLFLDEICEMPLEMQVKLLRILETRSFRKVGGDKEIPIDIRIVTATNRDVHKAVEKGLLREDLFFRINTIHIHVPPLRERKDDIPLLISYYLEELNRKYFRNIVRVSSSAMERIMEYNWPGNVRELLNTLERAYYLATPPEILPKDLPEFLQLTSPINFLDDWETLNYKEAKEKVLEKFEKEYLLHQLRKHQWNITRTAQECGIDRRTIHRLIKRYNIKSNIEQEKMTVDEL